MIYYDKRAKNIIYLSTVKGIIERARSQDNAILLSLRDIYYNEYKESRKSKLRNDSLLRCEIIERELVKRKERRKYEIEPTKNLIKIFNTDRH